MTAPNGGRRREVVALVVAAGFVLAVLLVCGALVWETVSDDGSTRLGENAADVLSVALGGMVAIIAAYVGYSAGLSHRDHEVDRHD